MCIGQNCASEQQMQQLRNKWPQNVTNSVNARVAQTGNKHRFLLYFEHLLLCTAVVMRTTCHLQKVSRRTSHAHKQIYSQLTVNHIITAEQLAMKTY